MIEPTTPVTLQYATPQVQPMLRAVGLAQRRIMWVILGAVVLLLSFGFSAAIMPNNGPAQIAVIVVLLLARIAMIVFMMIAVYQLASALGSSTTACVLYVIGMLLPLISLIVLLSVNQKATNLLKRAGIKVGLMGAKVADLPL